MRLLLSLCITVFCLGVSLPVLAGDTTPPAPGSAEVVAVGSAVAPATVGAAVTAAEIHDPMTAPAEALQDVQGAIRNVSKKGGWGLLAFMVVVMLTRLGAAYSARYKALAFLGKGYVHLTLATAGVFALAAYNALALGGSMYAALGAAIGAVLYKMHTLPVVKPGAVGSTDAPASPTAV